MRAACLLFLAFAVACAQQAPVQPGPAEQAEILARIRVNALSYTGSLPNYVCTQVTRRHIDPRGTENWSLVDTIQEQLTFVAHKESYSALRINGLAANNMRHDQLFGSESTGEFGTMLYEIFDPATRTTFAWNQKGALRSHMNVFAFAVNRAYAKYVVINKESGRKVTAGYRGTIYADRETNTVMRIQMETEGIPPDFPIQKVSIDLTYAAVQIGDRKFALPLKADVRSRQGMLHTWNEIEYSQYRKFGADATVTFESGDAAPGDAAGEGIPVFQSGVNLVLVPVVVRDSHGRAIGSLTEDDFQILDKGKRQTIESFSAVVRANDAPDVTSKDGIITATAAKASGSADHAAAAGANASRYLIYLFDDLNTDSAQMAAVRAAAGAHMQHGLTAADRAAIYTVSGRPALEFTADREKLLDTVRDLRAQPPVSHESLCPIVSYFLADLIQNKGNEQALEALVQRTLQCPGVGDREAAVGLAWAAVRREIIVGAQDDRVVLGALRRAIQRLEGMPGQRIIVIASPGFFAQTPEAIREKTGLLDRAAKAKVIVSSVDPRGVYVVEPDASDAVAPGRQWQQLLRTGAEANSDVLAELAQGTGGTFFHNNNNLNAGFERVAAAPEFSYVIGFSPRAWKADGSFHPINVLLPNQKGVSVEARRGYYAISQDAAGQAAKESLDDAVFSRDEIDEIPVELQTQYSKAGAGQTKLTVAAKIDVRSLHFQKTDDRNRDSLNIVIALFNADGGYMTGITKTVNLALRDGTLANMDAGLSVPAEFDVRPGTYTVRLVARESEGKSMSSRNAVVTIP